MTVQVPCPKCGVFNSKQDVKCWKCKREITDEDRKAADKINETQQEDSEIRQEELERSRNLTLTTSFQLAGCEIESEIEIVTAEVVYGMNVFRDMFAGITDVVGGRSGATQNVLRGARRAVLTELRREAFNLGADAVIAVDLNYQELSGGGKSGMIMLVASGTAVKVVKGE